LLTLTGGGGGEAQSDYSLAGMIVFEGIAVCVGLLSSLSRLPKPKKPADRRSCVSLPVGPPSPA
jgi:hypothetical protein